MLNIEAQRFSIGTFYVRSVFSTKGKRYCETDNVAIGISFSHDVGITALVQLMFLSLHFITFQFAKLVVNGVDSDQGRHYALYYFTSRINIKKQIFR